MTDRTCAELFDHTHATIIGDADRPILGVAYRSDQVSPGDAFCCIVGLKADGHAFAQDAVDRGATVLVVERMLEVKGDNDVTFILVNDTRQGNGSSCGSLLSNANSRSFSRRNHGNER